MNTEEVIEKLKPLLEIDEKVSFGYLFGSYAKGEQKKDSDVDIAILFNKVPEGAELLSMIDNLSDAVKKDVHLVILNKAHPFTKHQVFKNGIPILIKDFKQYVKFREASMDEFEEYKFISGMDIYDRL